ncbi:neutral/alkaline non-lysosomal ceramidase N-terminal domain-containing protein [Kocuria sp.]|uniref:neutral/alkaline non-lysosomal ceramidase N-terminal domain-containing protein n=1 Tax=Kocuria sp. TaxID=1871328 RepID=UPI0026DF5CF3|nr:neutral/alkaline non-lysosomal ceramidase N-terminal domain-containing protein [Kocuria sp.]MDO5617409.1 neutral/alkaline non-lysosomal ceramidase N-terminal domain-containing protein [Kocuria sp.]
MSTTAQRDRQPDSAGAATCDTIQAGTTPGCGGPTRRQLGRWAAVGALAVAGTGLAGATTALTPAAAVPAEWGGDGDYLIGRAVTDCTGPAGGVAFFGYGDTQQTGRGVHMRQRARAFVLEDAATGEHVAIVVADILSPSNAVRQAVLDRLARRAPGRWSQAQVVISSTHTHATPGGATYDQLHNVTTWGFQRRSFEAQVEAMVQAVVNADADRAPGRLRISRSSLTDAGVNRSAEAFRRNPAELQAALPGGIDPASVTLRLEREGRTDAVLNWFATHATSLTNTNRLISGDNKGYAQYALERLDQGVDLMSTARPPFVAAFANSNSGDITPNLNLAPGQGPTGDQFENMRIIGSRQADAVRAQLSSPGDPVGSGLETRVTYVDLRGYAIRPEFSGTGKTERTGWASLGTAFAAGSTEDGGGVSIFSEGLSGNPLLSTLQSWRYRTDRFEAAVQAPKVCLLAVGAMDWVQQSVPVQLIRLGRLWLAAMPGEMTAATGVLYRRAVAAATGAAESDVIVHGTCNGYTHYVSTPEEYDSQQYEGAATLYGRFTARAYCQILDQLARAVVNKTPVGLGAVPPDKSWTAEPSLQGVPPTDLPELGRWFGQVIEQPVNTHPGNTVRAQFAGAHPNHDQRRGDTFMAVERNDAGTWVRVRDDQDFDTRFEWQDRGLGVSRVTLSWTVPPGAAGTYRFVYRGNRRTAIGTTVAVSGTSRSFTVSG